MKNCMPSRCLAVLIILFAVLLSGCGAFNTLHDKVSSILEKKQSSSEESSVAVIKSGIVSAPESSEENSESNAMESSVSESTKESTNEPQEEKSSIGENEEMASSNSQEMTSKPQSGILPSDLQKPPLFYPYRAMLSANLQRAYDEICENVEEMKNTFTLKEKVPLKDIVNVISAVCYDNPEYFWLDNKYEYQYDDKGIVTQVKLQFNATAQDITASKKRFNEAADKIIEQAENLEGDIEKEKYVYDLLTSQAQTVQSAPINQSAYSALVGKKTVCAGYTRAFQYIMMQMKIPCYYCVGIAKEDHAWNIIKLGNDFYNLDVSWGDPVGNSPDEYHYEYFNLTDKQIDVDHRRTESSVNLPKCMGTQYGYDEYFGDGDPLHKTQKGGTPLSYLDLGFKPSDVITDLDGYYKKSYDELIKAGAGKHSDLLVIQNKSLLSRIYSAVQGKDWYTGYVTPAAKELGMASYSANIQANARELANGYYLLSQEIELR